MNNQIKLKSIRWRNIFSYGNKWNEFNFKTGISYITGRNILNNRRNFTGKSSFLKIIPFALFGKVEGITKLQIINWKNKKQAEVILKFEKNNIEYTIHRGIKPDIFIVLKDGEEMPQSSNKKQFQEEIEESILKMDFNTFMNIVYCDTNNNISVINAAKPIKREYLEKLFNLSYFIKLKEISNSKKKVITDKIVNITAQITSLEDKIKNSTSNMSKFLLDKKKSYSDIKNLQTSIKSYKNEFVESKIDELKDKLLKLKNKQLEVDNEVSNFNLLIEKINSKIFYLNRFKVDKILQSDIDNVNIEKTKIEKEILELETFLNSIDKDLLDLEYKELSESIIIHEGDLKHLKLDFNKNKKKIESIESDLISKPKSGKCPTCLQEVDFKHIEKELNEKLDQESIESLKLKKQIDNIISLIKSNKNTLSILEKKVLNFNKCLDKLKNLQSKNKSLKTEFESMCMGLKDYKKMLRYQNSICNLTTLKTKINKELSEVKSYTDFITAIEGKIQDVNDKIKEMDVLIERKQGIETSLIKLNEYIKDNENQIKNDKETLNNKNIELQKFNNMIEYLKQVIILCSDDKCKQFAISSYLPYLNERVNYYLNKSGVLFYIKLTGWLDYEIKGPGIKNCTYNNLSGAERISLDRSIQLASIDVKKQQSTDLIDLLILDEVLDSSLDDDGLVDMMNIIKSKQEDDNSKVLIVSHRNELGGLNSLFDFKYIVEKDKYSTLKEL